MHFLKNTIIDQVEEFPMVVFKNTLDYSSWAILSPISVGYNAEGQRFFMEARLYRKILAGLIHICVLLHLYLQFGEWLQTGDEVKFWTKMLSNISWATYLHSTIYTLWFKQKEMLDFLNKTKELCEKLNRRNFLRLHKKLVLALTLISPALVPGYGLVLGLLPSPKLMARVGNHGNWTSVHSLLRNDNVDSTSAYGKDAVNKYVWLWTARKIMKFLANASTMFGMLLCFEVALMLWMVIDGFVKRLQKTVPRAKDLEFVLDTLVDISKVFDACGNAFGHLFALTGMALLPILAIELTHLFQNNLKERIEFACDGIIFIGTLMFAASCNSLIKSTQTWIYQSITTKCKMLPHYLEESLRFRIMLLVNQINSNDFGINGIFFVITYGYVGTVCGLVITYALVVSQFRGSVEM